VDKATGDPVFAGTINETGTLEFEVTAAANNTTLARIIHAVEAAQGTGRRPSASWIVCRDLYAGHFRGCRGRGRWWPLAVRLDLDAGALQGAGSAGDRLSLRAGHRHAGHGVSGFAAAARRGILIKGGVYLEEARKLRAIALDKTGTITEGKPRLVATEVLWPPNLNRGFFPAASLAGHSTTRFKGYRHQPEPPGKRPHRLYCASRSRHRGPPGRPYLILAIIA
jgi:Cd2+/Zn2+-exporting ATPase